jgi:hypothetical protein
MGDIVACDPLNAQKDSTQRPSTVTKHGKTRIIDLGKKNNKNNCQFAIMILIPPNDPNMEYLIGFVWKI